MSAKTALTRELAANGTGATKKGICLSFYV